MSQVVDAPIPLSRHCMVCDSAIIQERGTRRTCSSTCRQRWQRLSPCERLEVVGALVNEAGRTTQDWASYRIVRSIEQKAGTIALLSQ